MKTSALLLGCLLALLAGCGPTETIDQAELDEVCGAPSPFRMLPLAPDEQLGWQRPLHVGDRVLYLISKVGTVEPGEPLVPVLGTTVWATGPCGESPVQLATGVTDIFTVDAWPDVPLGCVEETGEVVSLDPTGARPPHVVFAGTPDTYRCGLRWTKHGLVTVAAHDEERGALHLHPYPADAYSETSAPVTLLDPVRLAPKGRIGPGILGWTVFGFEDFVLAVTADDALVRVDLADGTVTTLQSGVGLFDASREGKYVLWQGPLDSLTDEYYPIDQVFLRDMTAGTDVPLAETSIRYGGLQLFWAETGAFQLRLGTSFSGPTRIYRLPGLESVDVAGGVHLAGQVDADRWLLFSIFENDLEVLDPRKGERRRLFDRGGSVRRFETDAVSTLEVRPCCVDGDERDEGPVWRLPYDFSPPQRLAKRATRFLAYLNDGRIVSPVAIDSQMVGTLVIAEPETQQELRIDDRVPAQSLDTSRAAEENILTYSVSDGERSGVYLARLPPHESPRSAAREPSMDTETLVLDVIEGPGGQPVLQTHRADAPPFRTPRRD